jgi:protein-S-isoprenylcysteine O-methyltransferase Ste14
MRHTDPINKKRPAFAAVVSVTLFLFIVALAHKLAPTVLNEIAIMASVIAYTVYGLLIMRPLTQDDFDHDGGDYHG